MICNGKQFLRSVLKGRGKETENINYEGEEDKKLDRLQSYTKIVSAILALRLLAVLIDWSHIKYKIE